MGGIMNQLTWIERVLVLLILAGLILLNTLRASDRNYHSEWEELSCSQKATLHRAYLYGKPFDLGLSLAAIAWKESDAGVYQLGEGDFGVMQTNLKYYLYHIGEPNTYWNRSKWATRLIRNEKLGFAYAIILLETSLSRHNSYLKAWGQYNGRGIRARAYAMDIWQRVKALKYIFKKEEK